jgi:hypothetical protein
MKIRYLALIGCLASLTAVGGCLLGNVSEPEDLQNSIDESLNRPPTVEITSPTDGTSANVRYSLELKYRIVDSSQSRMVVTITVGDTTLTMTPWSDQQRTFTFVPASLGVLPDTDVGIVVKATDNLGLVGADSVSLSMAIDTHVAPTLLTPNGAMFLSRNRIRLSVDDYWPLSSTYLKYEIQVANNDAFTAPESRTAETSSVVLFEVGAPSDGTYFWRARVGQSDYNETPVWESPWSAAGTFIVHNGIRASSALEDLSTIDRLVNCADGDVIALGKSGTQLQVVRCDERLEQRRWIRAYPDYREDFADLVTHGDGGICLFAFRSTDWYGGLTELLTLDAANGAATVIKQFSESQGGIQSARLGANDELWLAFSAGSDLVRTTRIGEILAQRSVTNSSSAVFQFEPVGAGTHGIYLGALDSQDVSIGKVDGSMAPVWSRAVSVQGDVSGRCLCVLPDGRCAVAYFEPGYNSSLKVTHMRMYGADGGDLWHDSFQDPAAGANVFVPAAIGCSANNDLFVLGTNGEAVISLAKYSDDGALRWVRTYDTCRELGYYSSYVQATAILVQDDRLFIAGGIDSNQEVWYLRLDHDGNLADD